MIHTPSTEKTGKDSKIFGEILATPRAGLESAMQNFKL
jgi:hypothetical protein